MWQRFKDFFQLSPRESRGVVVLLLILLSLQGYYQLLPYISKQPEPIWTFEWLSDLGENEEQEIQADQLESESKRKYTPFAIDLNSASIEDLQSTGLTYRQAQIILKYRTRGGKFFSVEDVQKIYSIDEDWIKVMKPYLIFSNIKKIQSQAAELITEPFDPNNADSVTLYQAGYKPWQIVNIFRFRARGGIFHEKEDLLKLYNVDSAHYYRIQEYVIINKKSIPRAELLELNSADSAALVRVKGIGPATAARLVKMRKEFGSIASIEQLWDIYGMDTARFELISSQVVLDPGLIIKININTATEAELSAHPYISSAYAKEIVNFRKKYKFYTNIEEINKLSLARPELFSKLAPYLTTGN